MNMKIDKNAGPISGPFGCFCTHRRLYTQMFLHTEAFTHNLLHRETLHRTVFAQRSFTQKNPDTEKLVHIGYTKIFLPTETFTRKNFTQSSFFPHKLFRTESFTNKHPLRTEVFTHKKGILHDTQTHPLLHTDVFTQKKTHGNSCTQQIFTQQAFTQRGFYTQNLLRAETFTQRGFCREQHLRTGAFTYRRFYTQTFIPRGFCAGQFLHTDASTHRIFFRADRNFYFPFLITHSTFHVPPLKYSDSLTSFLAFYLAFRRSGILSHSVWHFSDIRPDVLWGILSGNFSDSFLWCPGPCVPRLSWNSPYGLKI